MRIALISDLHGNLVALEAALADITARAVDRIVCLGDVALSGPQPRQVVGRLRALACPVIMGNCDAWMLDPERTEPRNDDARRIQEIDLWTVTQLASDDRAFLRTFQPSITVPLTGEDTLLCYHGSPRSFDEGILPETSAEDLAAMFAGTAARVYAGGHTHNQMFRRYGQALLLNPGSVGLPFDRFPPSAPVRNVSWAEYALLDADGPRLSVDLRRVPYGVTALVEAARASGMPHAAWWAADWG